MRPESQDEPDGPTGRHRASRRVLAWAPGLTEPAGKPEPATGSAEPAEVADESAAEPEPFAGIGLAAAPVSVTPPSSWRKAAWFIVAACSVVLVVLVFAAVRLAGPDGRFGKIDAFPGLPTGGLLTPQPPSSDTLAEPTSEAAEEPRPDSAEPSLGPDSGSETALPPGDPARPGPEQPGQGGGGDPTEGPPSVNTAPPPEDPPIQVDELLGATQQFFDVLPENIEAAWQMMSPQARSHGPDKFDKHWRKFRDVQLQSTSVDVGRSTVTAVVFVTGKNGKTATQRWKLTYRQEGSLAIDDAVLEDNGGFDDGDGPGNRPFG
jgi:hypothetical protein